MADDNCQVCFEALSSDDSIRCTNNHTIHYSCYRQLQNKQCIFKCGRNYCYVSLKLAPEELRTVDGAITWSTAKKDRLGQELIAAVKSRDIDNVKAAVEAGANIEARDAKHNSTPFLWAIYVNALEIARYLAEKGADVHAVGKHGANAMHDAVGAFNDKNIEKSTEIIDFLVEQKVDIDARAFQSNNTPLLFAITKGKIKAVELLLDRGANSTIKNSKGLSALHLVRNIPDDKITPELIQRLLSAGFYIDEPDEKENTPLHWALAPRPAPSPTRSQSNGDHS